MSQIDDLLDLFSNYCHGRGLELTPEGFKSKLKALIESEVIGKTPGNNKMLSECENYSLDKLRKIKKEQRAALNSLFSEDK